MQEPSFTAHRLNSPWQEEALDEDSRNLHVPTYARQNIGWIFFVRNTYVRNASIDKNLGVKYSGDSWRSRLHKPRSASHEFVSFG